MKDKKKIVNLAEVIKERTEESFTKEEIEILEFALYSAEEDQVKNLVVMLETVDGEQEMIMYNRTNKMADVLLIMEIAKSMLIDNVLHGDDDCEDYDE